ncbi:Csu type fimbrial protein [Lysobacter soyae]|uniref:Spore coat U domain-containing protein n=1 Tax=Lysobacter soyae TaxID=2764185 RepID=A0ABX8WLI1_9GAMM|nr:spore coat U domain-containing protein [Lysobacter sp. CJ11]QYR52486.1 spore coat U domain-containing protein [Lysobacter sp. CJ11]
MNSRALLLLLAMLWLVLHTAPARAATTCTTSAPDIVITGYDGTAQASANTTITVRCTTPDFALFGGRAYVNLCLYIDGQPRRLVNGASTLAYELYTASGSVWQAPSASPPSQQMVNLNYSVGWGGGSGSATVLINARIPAQSGAVNGTYSHTLPGVATSAEFRSSEPGFFGDPTAPPASCKTGDIAGANTPNFPFATTAQVTTTCQINTASDLNFGSVEGFITSAVNQTSQINLRCVGGTAWKLGLNNGINANGTQRRMKHSAAAEFVDYELYRDAGRSQRWGTTLNSDTQNGIGTGNAQTVTVYGQVPQQTATPGDYSDTVTVTITY